MLENLKKIYNDIESVLWWDSVPAAKFPKYVWWDIWQEDGTFLTLY